MTSGPERVEGRLAGVGSVQLFWQGWQPPHSPAGLVLVCHGGAEHSGRYDGLARALTQDSWVVYGLDMRGHGRSTGERMHAERFSDLLDDFDVFRRHVVGLHPDLPVFLLGQGVGGVVALGYALDHQELLRGCRLHSWR